MRGPNSGLKIAQLSVQSEISNSTTPCLCCHGLHYALCHGCYFCCSHWQPFKKNRFTPIFRVGAKIDDLIFKSFGGGPCLGSQKRGERNRQLELWFWLRPPTNHWGDIEVMKTPRDRVPQKETPIYEKRSSTGKETINGDSRIPQQGCCLFSSRPDPMNHANFWKCRRASPTEVPCGRWYLIGMACLG